MSLVTTAMSCRARSARHSASASAVLPEPTGPPIPTLKGPVSCSTASLLTPHSLRSEEPAVLGFVPCRQQRQAGREVPETLIIESARVCSGHSNRLAEREQQLLASGLSQRYRLYRRHYLVFRPCPQVSEKRLRGLDVPARDR